MAARSGSITSRATRPALNSPDNSLHGYRGETSPRGASCLDDKTRAMRCHSVREALERLLFSLCPVASCHSPSDPTFRTHRLGAAHMCLRASRQDVAGQGPATVP
eukprot:3877591-Rhodomonas_salina.1